ncbi:S-adenosyl-L-methionine-dependent methyltransferase [Butyriboletus roseoflavus]|nr:S-adenosyl-L-methionine-dependent methyltransferase [Butyriboletus roseoflavus]
MACSKDDSTPVMGQRKSKSSCWTASRPATGPLSFATYTQLCLSHPVHGYYFNTSHPVFGSRGDFTTSPEISQVFGEVLAFWMIGRWMSAGSKPFRIVELGPGRGTLMDDMLRVVRQLPAVRDKLDSVHLVETSPAMRALQRTTLRTTHEHGRVAFSWHDALDQITHRNDRFTMLVAHEFFDALPVHVIEVCLPPHTVCHRSNPLSPARRKRCVDGTKYSSHPPTTQAYATPARPPPSSPITTIPARPLSNPSHRGGPACSPQRRPHLRRSSDTPLRASQPFPVGSRIEVSGASVKVARQIAELLSPSKGRDGGGCALIIDYGAEKAVGNSLRAFKEHEIVDVFHRPGECDVTANVDFALLKEVLSDLVTPHGTLSQGTFLNQVGVQLRADRLIKAAPTEERKTAIAESVNRLVEPLGMGGQYAVLGVTGTPKEEAVWPFLRIHN